MHAQNFVHAPINCKPHPFITMSALKNCLVSSLSDKIKCTHIWGLERGGGWGYTPNCPHWICPCSYLLLIGFCLFFFLKSLYSCEHSSFLPFFYEQLLFQYVLLTFHLFCYLLQSKKGENSLEISSRVILVSIHLFAYKMTSSPRTINCCLCGHLVDVYTCPAIIQPL